MTARKEKARRRRSIRLKCVEAFSAADIACRAEQWHFARISDFSLPSLRAPDRIFLLKRIQNSDLADGFTARDIHQHGWSNLSDREHVQAGLDLLGDLDWIAAKTIPTGGRPRVGYSVNPMARESEELFLAPWRRGGDLIQNAG